MYRVYIIREKVYFASLTSLPDESRCFNKGIILLFSVYSIFIIISPISSLSAFAFLSRPMACSLLTPFAILGLRRRLGDHHRHHHFVFLRSFFFDSAFYRAKIEHRRNGIESESENSERRNGFFLKFECQERKIDTHSDESSGGSKYH